MDESGIPVAGARIGYMQSVPGALMEPCLTDSGGEAVIEGINLNADCFVQAEKEGFLLAWTNAMANIALGSRDPVVLVLKHARQTLLVGRVVDPDNLPVEGAQLFVETQSGASAMTDACGEYALQVGAEISGNRVCIYKPGYMAAAKSLALVKSETSTASMQVDFKLEPGHWVEGTVADVSGNPVGGIQVVAFDYGSPFLMTLKGFGPQREQTTDRRGFFRFEDLSQSSVTLRLVDTERAFVSTARRVAIDNSVQIVLRPRRPPLVAQGRVFDERTGKPIMDFLIDDTPYHDEQGRFVLFHERPDAEGVESGPDLLTLSRSFSARGYAWNTLEVAFAPEGKGQGIVVSLVHLESMHWRLVDAESRRPLAGVPAL